VFFRVLTSIFVLLFFFIVGLRELGFVFSALSGWRFFEFVRFVFLFLFSFQNEKKYILYILVSIRAFCLHTLGFVSLFCRACGFWCVDILNFFRFQNGRKKNNNNFCL